MNAFLCLHVDSNLMLAYGFFFLFWPEVSRQCPEKKSFRDHQWMEWMEKHEYQRRQPTEQRTRIVARVANNNGGNSDDSGVDDDDQQEKLLYWIRVFLSRLPTLDINIWPERRTLFWFSSLSFAFRFHQAMRRQTEAYWRHYAFFLLLPPLYKLLMYEYLFFPHSLAEPS